MQQIEEFLARCKCGIEYVSPKAFLSEMGADIENPQGRVGLHDLKLLGVFVKKIAVSEKYVHDCDERSPGELPVSRRHSSAQEPLAVAPNLPP